MQSKRSIHKVEFYITNVCNLDCDQCNRFNNFKFRGHQSWSDYESQYQRWGELLDIKHLVVLGGEPLLNPELISWIKGLNKIWPQGLQIQTNGTRLNYVQDLYPLLIPNAVLRNWIGVSLHNQNDLLKIQQEIEKFLQPPITITYNDKILGSNITYKDKNNVTIAVWFQSFFEQSAVVSIAPGILSLHQSVPEKAHSKCSFVQWKCYHLVRGKFYKCGPAALFPEFDKQFELVLTDDDRKLINDYKPLTLDNYTEYADNFFETLDNPLPQCKFCPDYTKIVHIAPESKL